MFGIKSLLLKNVRDQGGGVHFYQSFLKKKEERKMGKDVDYTIFKEVWDKEYTVTRQLYRNCLKWPDKIAIHDPFRKKTLGNT